MGPVMSRSWPGGCPPSGCDDVVVGRARALEAGDLGRPLAYLALVVEFERPSSEGRGERVRVLVRLTHDFAQGLVSGRDARALLGTAGPASLLRCSGRC